MHIYTCMHIYTYTNAPMHTGMYIHTYTHTCLQVYSHNTNPHTDHAAALHSLESHNQAKYQNTLAVIFAMVTLQGLKSPTGAVSCWLTM